ncbi:TonB-dependent receptor [Sphingomonas naphthae]|uniref:TonB-dependent receptor n=1 Tax=Sphingomonas naphthae TaxID=1813468 RepID=A0ABY7TJA9_9SPHN|nr:TonB-dependent receptor [Sphingomonas naphthae]WCT73035.1 TonB-dependent receptor [Sphingomonas naphthae]
MTTAFKMAWLGSAATLLVTAQAATAQTAPAPAPAASAPGDQLGDIVVTARKREETLQSVPVAVTAISGVQIQNNLASDLAKVGELAPQVSISQSGSGTGALLTIRGVSSASNDSGLDQSVAVEIDDVPLSRGQVVTAAVFDLASVQVLQGPQALFFGKNSPAGVISLRSADPTNRFEAYGTAGYEFVSDQAFGEGAISGPLTDALKARFAYRISTMKGYIKNIAPVVRDIINPTVIDPGAINGDRGPSSRDYAGRLTLFWTPSDGFEAKLKLLLNRQRRNASNGNSEPFCINGQVTPVLLGTIPIPNGDCAKDRVKSHGGVAAQYAANFPYANGGKPYLDSDLGLVSLTMTKKFDNFSLSTTSGYYEQLVKFMAVSDWSPFATIFATTRDKYSLLTQEIRANSDFDGPINLMAGIYYEHFNRPYFNSADLFHVFNPLANNYSTSNIDTTTAGDYYSAFGQATWAIVPTLELSGGARWSYDEKRARLMNIDNNPNSATGRALFAAGRLLQSRFSDSNVSPEAALTWKPSRDHTVYAAYKTGYKGGGISTPFQLTTVVANNGLQFEPEKVKGFEGGYKATLFDRKLRFDVVGYRYNYRNLQVVSYNSQTINFTLQNAASARIQGVQGSFNWLAVRGLSLSGNFGYNRARYTSFPTAPCYVGQTAAQGCVSGRQDLAGKALLRAPKFTYQVGADYDSDLIPGWDLKLSASASHSGSFQTATDYAPGGFQKDYWLVNGGIHLGPQDGPIEVAVIGRNLTNSYYMLNANGWSGSSNANQYVGNFNRPREVVIQTTVRW